VHTNWVIPNIRKKAILKMIVKLFLGRANIRKVPTKNIIEIICHPQTATYLVKITT